MNCERCQINPAVVHISEIKENKKRTIHLCENCAREMQAGVSSLLPQVNLHNFLAGLFSNQSASPISPIMAPENRCPTCTLSEGEFAATGLLGCGDCYQHFGARLDPIYRRIHGSNRHTGKVPERTGAKVKLSKSIDKLKSKLKEAIRLEEFEAAAKMRDEIRELEQKLDREEN